MIQALIDAEVNQAHRHGTSHERQAEGEGDIHLLVMVRQGKHFLQLRMRAIASTSRSRSPSRRCSTLAHACHRSSAQAGHACRHGKAASPNLVSPLSSSSRPCSVPAFMGHTRSRLHWPNQGTSLTAPQPPRTGLNTPGALWWRTHSQVTTPHGKNCPAQGNSRT